MKTTWLVVVALVMLLTACAQQPISQQLSNAQGQISQYRARTNALVDAGLISKADAQARVDSIKKAQTGLDSARLAWSTCLANSDAKCTEAADLAAGAQAILGQVEAYLTAKEKAK